MSSITATPPPPPTPSSGFFSEYGGGGSYTISDKQPLPESSTGVSNSPVITVIVFSITVIVSISLCFLIRVLSGRCIRRMQPDEESGMNGGSTRILPSRRVQPLVEEQPRDPKSVQQVNKSQLRLAFEKSKSVSGADCPICLSKFKPMDNLRLLPICCHAFHAECVDLWLESNQSCPLCRSAISASETEILQKIASFATPVRPDPTPARILINQPTQVSEQHGSLVRTESDNKTDEIGPNRSWLREYVETLSSTTSSFRSSASSRRGETLPGDGYWDIEASRAGEEISEMFRWFSGI